MARHVFKPSGRDVDVVGPRRAETAAATAHRDGKWGSLGALMHLAHEIRTPLSSMMALTQLLRDGSAGALNAQQQKYVEVIERNGQNVIALINDVLDLSRIELGNIEVKLGPLEIGEQLREIAVALGPLASIKGIQLIVGSVDSVPWVLCDRNRLRQVLTNLVGNALKFTDQGQVVLSVGVEDGMVAVHVTDSGVGIPEVARERLFEEIFPGGGLDAYRNAGAGLGLAISHRLVRLMGGQLSVQSVEGVGSRFTFTLPIERTPGDTDVSADPIALEQISEKTEVVSRGSHRSQDEQHGTNTARR